MKARERLQTTRGEAKRKKRAQVKSQGLDYSLSPEFLFWLVKVFLLNAQTHVSALALRRPGLNQVTIMPGTVPTHTKLPGLKAYCLGKTDTRLI